LYNEADAEAPATTKLTVTFDAAMNETVDPVITTNATTTLTAPSGVWTNATTYTVTYTVVDANIELPDVLVNISGAQDVAGNAMTALTGETSGTEIDTFAPTTTISINDITADNTLNAAEEEGDVAVTGTVTGNFATVGMVTLTVGGTDYTGAVVDGGFSIDVPGSVLAGETSISASVTGMDAAGNTTEATDTQTYTVDVAIPDAPVITGITDDTSFGSDLRPELTSDGVTRDTSPMIEGTAEANTRIQLFIDGVASGSPVFATGGTFAITPVLVDGDYAITVTATDSAGNVSAPSEIFELTIDTTPPAAPTIDLATASDDGSLDSDNITNEARPTFTGTAEAGSTVLIRDDNAVEYGRVIADSEGVWTFTPDMDLPLGTTNFAAEAVDIAGNGTLGNSIEVTIDTTAPTVTVTLDDTDLLVGETTTVTFTFSEAVADFTLDDVTAENGTLTGLTSDLDGDTWTATFTPAVDTEDATNLISVTSDSYIDIAGNDGAGADSANYTVETLAPTATIDVDATALKAGETATVTITFTEAVADFDLTDLEADSGTLSALTTTDNIIWTATLTPDTDTEAAMNAVRFATGFAYTDVAGNPGTGATSGNYAVDTAVPDAPVITAITDDTIVGLNPTESNDDSLDLTGTAEAGASVEIFVDGTSVATVTADATTGDWSYIYAVPVTQGAYTLSFTAEQTDLAGNTSAASAASTIDMDFSPQITGFGDNDLGDDTADNGTGTAVENADTNNAAEAAAVTVSGTIAFEDIPSGQTYTVTNAPLTPNSVGLFQPSISNQTTTDTVGELTWTFTVANSAINALGADDVITQDYDVTITDNNGDATTQTITVLIQGTNDGPAITAQARDAGEALTETAAGPQTLTASGTLTVQDADSGNINEGVDFDGDTLSVTAPTAATVTYTGDAAMPADTTTLAAAANLTFGVAVEADGTEQTITYDYTATDTIDWLAAGETVELTYAVELSDGESGTATTDVVITITGTNDAPTVVAMSTDDTAAITEVAEDAMDAAEGDTLTDTGTITFADLDLSDEHTASVTAAPAGALGLLTLGAVDDAANTVGWTYTVADGDLDYLATDQEVTEVFTVTIDDGNMGTIEQTVTVTLTGTNDAPTIGVVAELDSDSASRTEGDAGLTATGTLSVADVDVTDEVTVVGAPTVSTDGPDGGLMNATLAGMLTLTPAPFATVIADGDTTGTLTWDFDSGSEAFNFLNVDDTLELTYSFDVTDSKGGTATQEVTITIEGTNDGATIAGDDEGTATEAGGASNATAGMASDTGTLTSIDADNADNTFMAATGLVGTYGTLDITAAGVWTYTLADGQTNVQALNAAEDATDMITVQSIDGTTHVVTIDITGANDAAVITGDVAGGVIEMGVDATGAAIGTATVTGDLDHTDVDGGNMDDTWNTTVVTDGTNGSLTIGTDGQWSYTLTDTNIAVDELDDGESITDTVTVATADGTTQDITIMITGSDDAAIISGADSGSVTEVGGDGTAPADTASGDLDHTDVDGDDANDAWTAGTVAGTYGSLMIGVDGMWTYTLDDGNATVNALNTTDAALTDTITVTTSGGTTKDIQITINGTNDDATIAGDDTGAATEAGGVLNGTAGTAPAMGTLTSTDVDNPDNTFTAATVMGTYGNLVINGAGVWTYTLDDTKSVTQALDDLDTVMDTITVTSIDGTSHDIVIDVTGAADAAVITGDVAGGVTEAGGVNNGTAGIQTFMGDLDHTDVDGDDVDDAWTTQVNAAGSYGTLTINSVGEWTYTLAEGNPAVEALNAGELLTDTITRTTTDGTTQDIVITITGSNDAPEVSGVVAAPATTDIAAEVSIDLLANASDKDAGGTLPDDLDVASVTVAVTGGAWAPTVAFNVNAETGVLTIDPAQFAALDETESRTLTFTYDVVDEAMAATQTTATITVNGTNHAPVIELGASELSGAVTEITEGDMAPDPLEGSTLTASGTITFDDVEQSDTHSVTVTSLASMGTPATTDYIGTFSSGFSSVATGPGKGTIIWEFNLVDANIDMLREGETITQTYQVSIEDQANVQSQTQELITVTITGTNDQPVISAVTNPATQTEANDFEGTQSISASGSLTVSDTDSGGTPGGAPGGTSTVPYAGDVLTASIDTAGTAAYTANGGMATMTLPTGVDVAALVATSAVTFTDNGQDATGSAQTFNFDYSAAAGLDWLGLNDTLTITYDVAVTDDSGADDADEATDQIVITITGTNDGPVASAAVVTSTDENIAD
ncbi:VCBS domain-containing protein, partial [Paraglaciecola sp.]|uniref:VCBS domain-containing protein n=1 Tax=Paraglaciecola sp. TaxID=1920173 RepID=UPI003EF1E96E